ncbi:hypothetical protein [Pteropox virus]|uniref:Uncharacterized protein n=1 Tax=Pteropox virus TaxID=1873698 RepID=A0A1B1MRA0_9POXV|nr:hypothetical protein [Pteropox virus]ANS71107.1 hypothetical protein [Pteropox virus]
MFIDIVLYIGIATFTIGIILTSLDCVIACRRAAKDFKETNRDEEMESLLVYV